MTVFSTSVGRGVLVALFPAPGTPASSLKLEENPVINKGGAGADYLSGPFHPGNPGVVQPGGLSSPERPLTRHLSLGLTSILSFLKRGSFFAFQEPLT